MMKKFLWLSTIVLLLGRLGAQAQSSYVKEIIDDVELDSLTYTLKVLSGEVGSKNGAASDTIYSRGVFAPGHDLARDYLKGSWKTTASPPSSSPSTGGSPA